MRILPLLLLSLPLTSSPRAAWADEGMWTFNAFPGELLKKKHGFAPSPEWLDHLRLASVRIAGGCSASLVSPNGLVLTNHHCVRSCVQQLSTAKDDLVARGVYAKSIKEERQCPAMEINQLLEISDVTARMLAATEGLSDKEANLARKGEQSKIERECATSDLVRCEMVSLFNGARYDLYRYRRFQDVRLVFAPEQAIAHFGGDPDNFNFPRFAVDAAFLRVWEGGAPLKAEHYLKWSSAGAKDGELVFVSGNPGSTRRLKTVAELAYLRDFSLPETLFLLSELRGQLSSFSERGPEQERIARSTLASVENSYKALEGRRLALLDRSFIAGKTAAEDALRKKIDGNPALKKKYGGAFEAIAAAQVKLIEQRNDLRWKEEHRGFGSQLFGHAVTLVRWAEEKQKPNEQRLPEYAEAKLPPLKAKLLSQAPIYPALEIELLAFLFSHQRAVLGPDDPFVKLVLGKDSPRDVATRLVRQTLLARDDVRRKLFEGNADAIRTSKDPLIRLVAAMDPVARQARKRYEDEIEAIVLRESQRIARARGEIEGPAGYPDATFTPRVSFGTVEGFPHNGRTVPAFTNIAGLFERATGKYPFALPKRWEAARPRLSPQTPVNLATNNDIIGGNSGSPMVNVAGELVGLVFDGNIYSLGGDYGFDARLNRTVAVHSSLILEALEKVYDARALVAELK